MMKKIFLYSMVIVSVLLCSCQKNNTTGTAYVINETEDKLVIYSQDDSLYLQPHTKTYFGCLTVYNQNVQQGTAWSDVQLSDGKLIGIKSNNTYQAIQEKWSNILLDASNYTMHISSDDNSSPVIIYEMMFTEDLLLRLAAED